MEGHHLPMQHHSHRNKTNHRQQGSYFHLDSHQREQKKAIKAEIRKSKNGIFQRLLKALKLKVAAVLHRDLRQGC